VEKALREQGVEYEIVRGPFRPSQRVDLERLSGQRFYPVIEFEDGTVFRDESKIMAATISAGRLDERQARRLSRPPAGCEARERHSRQGQERCHGEPPVASTRA
jgi:glutathione S-transferase